MGAKKNFEASWLDIMKQIMHELQNLEEARTESLRKASQRNRTEHSWKIRVEGASFRF